jgi:hypothetical protein
MKMPELRSTADMHNPQEADVVVTFVVDLSGDVSETAVVSSKTWPVRAGGPSTPNYFDQVAVEQVASRKYAPRSDRCRGQATFLFRFQR